MSQSQSQVRVIDPILSKVVRGFSQSQGGFVAGMVFPRVPVSAYGGTIIEFGKESFRLVNTRRAPGTATQRVKFGYDGKPYAIVPSALDAQVPREWMRDATQVPGIDLASRAIRVVHNVLALGHEYASAQLALDPAKYGANNKVTYTTANSWWVDTSDPLKDISEAKDAIRAKTGMKPNLLVLSPSALSALKVHPKLIERIKYTKAESLTLEMLANLFEVPKVVEAEGIVASGAQDAFGDIWKKDALLCYSDQSPAASNEVPSYGYTYVIEGMPAVEKPWWEDSTKSWIYGVSDDNTPVVAGADAGYLFQNAGVK